MPGERLKKADYELQVTESAKNSKDKACAQSRNSPSPSSGTQGGKSSCDEASELAQTLEARVSERDSARTALNNTPELVTEEVWDNFVYPVRTHRWASNYRFSLQSSSPGSAPTPQQDGALRFEDQEHVGFPPGGLQAESAGRASRPGLRGRLHAAAGARGVLGGAARQHRPWHRAPRPVQRPAAELGRQLGAVLGRGLALGEREGAPGARVPQHPRLQRRGGGSAAVPLSRCRLLTMRNNYIEAWRSVF